MKKSSFIVLTLVAFLGCSNSRNNDEVKSLLTDLMNKSHKEQDWYVPTRKALMGLTVQQSNWKDSTENHSISELVSHLVFWNQVNLRAFKGEDMSNFEVDNESTFITNTGSGWRALVDKLDSLQTNGKLQF